MKKAIIIIFAALTSLPTMAWGPTGHRIIARIAYEYMSKKAIKQVDNVLGKNGMIYWVNWADEIKSDTIYKESYDWHFQDMESGLSDSTVISFLTDYPKEGGNMFRTLDSLYLLLQNEPNNRDALRFFVHISGDRFCPMHTGHLSDKGGNAVKVKWFYTPSNLHKIWDENLIDYRGYSYTEYAQMIIDMHESERAEIEAMTQEEIVLNNYHMTCAVYDYQETWNGNAYHYVYRWKEPMERQLYMAGVRLALLLNELYK